MMTSARGSPRAFLRFRRANSRTRCAGDTPLCERALVSLGLLTERGTFCRGGGQKGSKRVRGRELWFRQPQGYFGRVQRTVKNLIYLIPSIRLVLCLIKLDAYSDNLIGKPSYCAHTVIMIRAGRKWARVWNAESLRHTDTFFTYKWREKSFIDNLVSLRWDNQLLEVSFCPLIATTAIIMKMSTVTVFIGSTSFG